jgi:hypothetical protein
MGIQVIFIYVGKSIRLIRKETTIRSVSEVGTTEKETIVICIMR